MRRSDKVLAVVRGWVTKAENDLTTASHTLELRERCPTDTVCFHAQQCVEKYLKAVLVWKSIDFPQTHDIERLLGLLPHRAQPKLAVEEQRTLTTYATITRYPGDYEPIPLAEARRAVRIARRVRGRLRALLPHEASLQERR